jgi:hypothetical protein
MKSNCIFHENIRKFDRQRTGCLIMKCIFENKAWILRNLPEDIFTYYPQENCVSCYAPKIKKLYCILKDLFVGLSNTEKKYGIMLNINVITLTVNNNPILTVTDDLKGN